MQELQTWFYWQLLHEIYKVTIPDWDLGTLKLLIYEVSDYITAKIFLNVDTNVINK